MPDIFSKEVPELLLTHFNHLLKSAISVEVIRKRQYRSIMGKAELKNLGFSKIQRRTPGLLIPLWSPDGSSAGYQYRPDKPRTNEKDKPIKYENATGEGLHFDVSPVRQPQIADPKNELWFTEGAKKVDALASKGICGVNLSGVWGFKGKNEFGVTSLLADFDLIPWKGRRVYLAFDSDAATNRMVALAQERLKEHLERKGSIVKIIPIPAGPDNAKVGIDDYLAAGKSLEELRSLAQDTVGKPEDAYAHLQHTIYRIEQGRICLFKKTQDGPALLPLANFIAKIKQELIYDDGQEESREFLMEGEIDGRPLPPVSVLANRFPSMDWVLPSWGSKVSIAAGSAMKDHLRVAIQLMSNGTIPKRIYTHTGWRSVDDERIFLSGSGALGKDNIEVALPDMLARYKLPANLADIPARDAIKASLGMLAISKPAVMYPLWSTAYLSPLSSILDPAFTLWLQGRTGSFKSVLSALALCHFGDFTYLTLPAAWRDSANFLEKLMFLLKDLPLVIDDFPPAPTTSAARDLEQKAEIVIRAQGNKAGRGRLRADTSLRTKYSPRGMVITSGEQLPAGESGAARLFVCDLEKNEVETAALTACQKESRAYKYAMAHYILWLKENYSYLAESLPREWEELRNKAVASGIHLRLPAAVAWLYLGFKTGILFVFDNSDIESSTVQEMLDCAWDTLIMLAARQGARVDEERPAMRFLDAFGTLLMQRKIFVITRDSLEPYPDETKQGRSFVGWVDDDGYYLMPSAVYGACAEFYQKSGGSVLNKPAAIWSDLRRLGMLTEDIKGENNTVPVWIGAGRDDGAAKRVVPLRRGALDAKIGGGPQVAFSKP